METPARDPRRDACDELARGLVTPGGEVTDALLDLVRAGVPGAAPERTAEAHAREIAARCLGNAPAPIGIWKPEATDGALVFVRDETAAARDWWAPQATLTPKRSLLPLRVALLGESTAAGWFYAPVLTPAGVLAEQLATARGPGIYEVLDLTMVNQQPGALVELAGAVLQLAPDVIVVFAGNNWPQRLPAFPGATLADCAEAARALRAEGVAGLRGLADERTRRAAERALEVMARLAGMDGVSLVVVVPEVNLADWPRDRPVPWLPGDGAARWHAAHARTLGALATGAGAGAEAEAAARAMVALDGGVSPTSYRLLGDALAALGRADEARAGYLAAVDARAWDNFPSTPSATSTVREAIRRRAAEHGYACVDLPAILAGPAPGRRAFLDYCHLTADGMARAMAAVAAEVARVADPGQALAPRAPAVTAETEAAVRFMTALYTAHWAEPPDLGAGPRAARARDWLAAALEASPAIEEAMRAYATTRAVPAGAASLSAAHQRFHGAISELERQTTHDDGLDPDVLAAIGDVLAARGRPLDADVEARLIAQHGVERGGVDLLRAAYHWRRLDRYDGGGGFGQEACAFYRARWPASHFCLVAGGDRAVSLALTARLPRVQAERAGELGVEVNGAPVGRVALVDRWRRATLEIPTAWLRRGINRLTLRWPDLPPEGDAALALVLRRLDQGVATDLHPVFGEVFALRAFPTAP